MLLRERWFGVAKINRDEAIKSAIKSAMSVADDIAAAVACPRRLSNTASTISASSTNCLLMTP
jgi:hypothetical protein